MSQLKIPIPTIETTLQADAYEARMHFLYPDGNIRLRGFVTEDAQRVTIALDQASEKQALMFASSTDAGNRVLWKFAGIQSIDHTEQDPLTLSYFADADHDAELLRKELTQELASIRAGRAKTEASLAIRPAWHDERMRQLGRSAVSRTWLPGTVISLAEWRKISPHRHAKPPVIEPYVPPEPAPVRYGLVRPVGYRTSDAVAVDVRLPSPEHTWELLTLLTESAPPLRSPQGDLATRMVCWKIFGIQSIDVTTVGDGEYLRLYVDADARHQEIKQRLEETTLEQLAKDFNRRNR